MNKPGQSNQEKLQDPICNMQVSSDSPWQAVYQGQEYFFCSERCLAEFQKNPAYYAGETAKAAKAESSGMFYTCPMHPEVRQATPGQCPQCGMDLEPEETGESGRHGQENPAKSEKMVDPVCGMLVQPDSPFKATHKGQNFAFCSPRCLELFQDQPERYLKPGDEKIEKAEKDEASPAAEGEEAPEHYLTCPMHPEVKEPLPRCPKCGMFLQEPEKAPEKAPMAKEKAPARAARFTPVPWTRRSARKNPAPAPSAAWPWNGPSRRPL